MPKSYRQWTYVRPMVDNVLDLAQFAMQEHPIPELKIGQALIQIDLINIHSNTRTRMALGMIALGVVLLAGATGSVGSIAAQLARRAGASVVGFAGGDSRCSWAKETLGLDDCIDYRATDLLDKLRLALPDGIDVSARCSGSQPRLRPC